MSRTRYWFLVNGPRRLVPPSHEVKGVFGRMDVLDLPEEQRRRAVEARSLSIPGWHEAYWWWPEGEGYENSAPILFTTREAAEAELRRIERDEPEAYLESLDRSRTRAALEGGDERGAEDSYNETVSNTEPYEVRGLDADLLALKLEDSEFPYVVVDGQKKLREEFQQELEKENYRD